MGKKLKPLIVRVEAALLAAFPDLKSGLQHADLSDRVLGYVVSEKFKGKDHAQRQAKLRKVLDAAFDGPDRARIGAIVTLTPTEAQVERAA